MRRLRRELAETGFEDIEALVIQRESWEKGLTVVSETVSKLEEHVLVVLTSDEHPQDYHCHRYFPVGGEWAVSMDGQGVTAERALQWLGDPKAIPRNFRDDAIIDMSAGFASAILSTYDTGNYSSYEKAEEFGAVFCISDNENLFTKDELLKCLEGFEKGVELSGNIICPQFVLQIEHCDVGWRTYYSLDEEDIRRLMKSCPR